MFNHSGKLQQCIKNTKFSFYISKSADVVSVLDSGEDFFLESGVVDFRWVFLT